MRLPGAEWEITSRSKQCARTGKPFQEGEALYTLLYLDDGKFRREDLCEPAWRDLAQSAWEGSSKPFSFWKSKFELPPTDNEPDPLPHNNAEALLRQLLNVGPAPGTENACYILALMLERKRTLRQVDSKLAGNVRILMYEHAKTGEAFMIADPDLHLDEIETVQREVSAILEKQFGTAKT